MATEHFDTEEVIFSEGEESSKAYRVLSGSVGLYRMLGDQPMMLAFVGEGEIFGELALICEKPRAITARALAPSDLEVITKEDFSDFIVKKPDLVVPYLTNLFEHIRSMTELLAFEFQFRPEAPSSDDDLSQRPSAAADPSRQLPVNSMAVRLAPANEVTRQRSNLTDIVVDKFPFRLGREHTHAERNVFIQNDLVICDAMPYQVSRSHCSIERTGDGYYVRDRGSTMGTIVNGAHIGGLAAERSAELRLGENSVVLGDQESPYRYIVTVTES